jgi:UDP-glucose 4-epimerase
MTGSTLRKCRVLITGAAGYLGSYIGTVFGIHAWHVIGLDIKRFESRNAAQAIFFRDHIVNDLSNPEDVTMILRSCNPDIIIHAAGPASVEASFEAPHVDFLGQLSPLSCLLDAVKTAAPTARVLLLSSAAVYGSPTSLPISEDMETKPISPYGYHKRLQEMLLSEYAHLFDLRYCAARIFSTYGPGLRHLAVKDIVTRALANDFTLHGSGNETRDYLHARDVASAIFCICTRSAFSGEVINVASGIEVRIADLANTIYDLLGCKHSRTVAGTGAGSKGKPSFWRADITRLNALGFSPKICLEDGLRETISWIRGHE